MSNVYKEVEKDNIILKILVDEDPDNPRGDDESLGRMICWHKRYILGDDHNFEDAREFWEDLAYDLGIEYNDETPVNKLAVEVQSKVLVLPLFLLDHSGISMRTSSFNDPWDSGLIGYIYATYDSIKKEFGTVDLEKATKTLQAEVKAYDQYLTGDMYGFQLIKRVHCDHCGIDHEEDIDSCWGFFGDVWKENGLYESVAEEYRHLVDML